MEEKPKNFTTYAFTPRVKAEQERQGSRAAYARMEQSGDRNVLTGREIPHIETRDSFYLSTVGENGWPYVQFRGGPRGFLKVLDDRTLGMADFRGNRQYISAGNIAAEGKAVLFLMDYPRQERLKIWAHARVVAGSEDPALLERLRPTDYEAVVERLLVFDILAYDWNCPQHITPRYTLEEIRDGIRELDPELLRSCCPDGVASPA